MCVDVNFKPWLSTGLFAAEMIRTGPSERIGLSGISPHLFLADTLTLYSNQVNQYELRPPNSIVPTNIF